MSRNLLTLTLGVLLVLSLVPADQCVAAEKSLRYSIAVARFENRSNWRGQWNLGDAWGAVLTDSLNQTGRFIVLGEKVMRSEALDEQDFAASGRAAGGGKKVTVGQMTPAQLLVKGDITHFSDQTGGGGGAFNIKGFRVGTAGSASEINVVMYIVDSSTGQVVASKKCHGKVSKKGLRLAGGTGGFYGDVGGFKKTNAGKAMEKAVDEGVCFLVSMLDEVPWTGSVILVKGSKIYINRGSREGVTVGQTFDVGESTILRDPDTGEVLDESIESVGTVRVVKVKEKIAICDVVTGSGIRKGMTVGVADD
jgi:curli biogenesis system outer membrane secretion channel CsgG